MDFDLTEEQRLLQDSINRLLEDRYGDFERRKSYQKKPCGWSRSAWQDFASIGLTALPFSEEMGGIGGGPVETMIVMEAIGRWLALEPFLSTVVIAGTALNRSRNRPLAQSLISRIAEGTCIATFAHSEPQSRYNLANVKTSARSANGHYVIDGRKSLVLHGCSADKLIVSARLGGLQMDPGQIGLFVLDANAPGIEVHGTSSQDGQRIAEIILSGTQAGADQLLAGPEEGYALIQELNAAAIAAVAAEAVGALEHLHAITIDYLKTRKQFGAPIGSFQVLQHKAADMMIAIEQARSMAYYAAMMLSAPPPERDSAMSAVKIQINNSARFVGQQAIQLHGGIGMTLEYQASHYFKRLTAIEQSFGDTPYHLAELGKFQDLSL